MVKKILSIAAIIVGALTVISGVAPMIVGAVMELQIANSVGIIGGADGPTAVMVVGTLGVGSAVAEILVGIALIIVGVFFLRKCRKK